MASSARKQRLLNDVRSRYKNGSRSSPEPNCPICLERIEDRAFANKCFHDFCKTCLVEWSKVKAECPVCRQRFDKIIYNVKAMDEYEEQHVAPRFDTYSCWHNLDNIQRWFSPVSAHASHSTTQSSTHHHFRYPPTFSPLRSQVLELQSLIDNIHNVRRFSLVISSPTTSGTSVTSHMTRQAPEVVPPITTSEYRRYIYRNNLWVLPFGNGDKKRYRESSAEFYRRNPACTHRLVPWLNREMVALLSPAADVPGMVDVVMRNIRRYNIASNQFRQVVQPFINNYTDHFIHEFFNFARSVYDMEAYSKIAKYVSKERADLDYTRNMLPRHIAARMQTMPLNLSNDNDSDSSSDSSVIIVDSSDSETEDPSSSSCSRTDTTESSSNSNTTETSSNSNSNEFSVNTIEEETEAAVSSINVNIGTNDRELSITLIDDFDNPTPGPSGVSVRKVVTTLIERGSDSETDIDVGGREDNEANYNTVQDDDEIKEKQEDIESDDSVEIIGVLKPKHERTPEIIDVIESDDGIKAKKEIEEPKIKEDLEKERKRTRHKRRHSRSHRKSKHKKDRKRRRRSRSRSHSRNHSSDSSSDDDSNDGYWKVSTRVSLPKIKLSRFHWTSSSSGEESVDSIRKKHDSKKYSSDERTHYASQPRLQKLQSVIISPTSTPSDKGSFNTPEY